MRDTGYLAASSPAYGDKKIYVTILERTQGRARRARGLRSGAKTGKVSWSKPLASRCESSPIFVDRPHLLRHRERGRLRDAADDGERAVEVPGGRRGQGRPRAQRRHALLRHLRRQRLRDQASGPASRSGASGTSGANFGLSAPATSTPRPAVAFGRVVHRQHRRQHVLVLGRQRQARLAPQDGLLRVRLASSRLGPGDQADRLLRQLRRHLLRARRPHRRHALGVPRRRQDLRRRDGRRRPRLLLQLGSPRTPARSGSKSGKRACRASAARSIRSCPTARRST